MKQQEEWAFQNAQKQIAIQTIDIISGRSFHKQSSQQFKKTNENVNWKFNALAQNYTKTSPKQKYTRNISFQDGEYQSQSQDDDRDEDQFRQSDFTSHYSQFQEVYRKKLGFGINWIGKRQYFSSIFIDPSRIEKNNLPYYFPQSPFTSDQINTSRCTFDSQFQSGNLFSAYKIDQFQYDLILQNDINTKGNTQWFYFRLTNPPKNKTIKINIVNFRKTDSLFNYGMLPCVYSWEQNRKGSKGWLRGGKNIKYFKNDHQIQNSKRYYFTLTFTISTPYERDTLLIAHSYPYTVTDLQIYMDSLFKVKYKKELLDKQTLINTVGKNKVQVLTIKEPNPRAKQKPLIFIMARQHPGQTPGSFVCEGLIDYFLTKDKEGQYFRKNYQIKVIPMVNPDGVSAGNYRTNLFGYDLNRRWQGGTKAKNLHEATYIKKYLIQLAKGREVAFIIDLHGHSRKLFSFFYGNPNPINPIQPRIYPLLCSKLGPNLIRFEDSTFANEEYKRNTARVQLSSSFKLSTVFTYQTSFYGHIAKNKQKQHFTPESLKQLGQILGKSLFQHQRGKELFHLNPEHKEIILYKKCLNQLRNNGKLIAMGQKDNSGSESQPEQCEVKDREQQKLQQNDDYNFSKTNTKIKIVRKVVKKEPPVKEVFKSLRQMQVLDIAQVHSAFPSNIIALIPTSFINRMKKPTLVLKHTQTQTEESPLVKIYSSCKQQDFQGFSMQNSAQLVSEEQNTFRQKKATSNLLRGSMVRPRTTVNESESRQYTPLSVKTQRKSRQIRRREQTLSNHKKPASSLSKSRAQQKGVQTSLSFGRGHCSSFSSSTLTPNNSNNFGQSNLSILSNFKVRLSNQADILEYKSIDPSFMTINYSRGKSDTKSIGRNISKNIVDNLKIRRKNIF